MTKSHRDRYQEQYNHPMCGETVETLSGVRFIIERVVNSRFGHLAINPSDHNGYKLDTLKHITYPVKCPACESTGPITVNTKMEAFITLGSPIDGADFENVENGHVHFLDSDQAICDKCSHEANYSTFIQ